LWGKFFACFQGGNFRSQGERGREEKKFRFPKMVVEKKKFAEKKGEGVAHRRKEKKKKEKKRKRA